MLVQKNKRISNISSRVNASPTRRHSRRCQIPGQHNRKVWRTDGHTEFSLLDRVCIPCSAVMMPCGTGRPYSMYPPQYSLWSCCAWAAGVGTHAYAWRIQKGVISTLDGLRSFFPLTNVFLTGLQFTTNSFFLKRFFLTVLTHRSRHTVAPPILLN